MDSASTQHILNSFSISTKKDWLKAATVELEGADPMQKLAFENGNLTHLPYYDHQDFPIKEHFQLQPSANEFLGARTWHNMPSIEVKKESDSNHSALASLNSGADGIIFNINSGEAVVSGLLETIEWPYCTISFEGAISAQFLSQIHAYALKRKFDVATLTGCVFGHSALEKEFANLALFEGWKNFHPLGIAVVERESPDEEIATALTQAVKQIDFLTDNGLSLKHALQTLAFKVLINEDFFLSIAKLKTLRHLWNNVVTTFDVHSNAPIFIHASSSTWSKKEYLPNGNMLKSTTAALSAILGGCDALTISPEENNNAMMTRVARNVSLILREESHLSKVADPTAGSYYLESLIDQLSTKAWKKFQTLI